MREKHFMVKPMVFPHFNSRCHVDLIDFQSQPDRNYEFILVHQDHLMKFDFKTFPYEKSRSHKALAQYIFITWFPVCTAIRQWKGVLQYTYRQLKKLKIIHGKARYSQSQGSFERSNQDIENMLTTLIQDK
ncbi:KRAB-A domain-containing protein 2 [Trichonephila clavipes]|nr:KRAB-A domain-containing protein 2 [Trichonephila clavipes]